MTLGFFVFVAYVATACVELAAWGARCTMRAQREAEAAVRRATDANNALMREMFEASRK